MLFYLFFYHSICCPRQWDGIPPCNLSPPASNQTSPLPLPPTVGSLLGMVIDWWQPKARVPYSALLFNGACVAIPNRQTNHGAAKPYGVALCETIGSSSTKSQGHRCPTYGERGQSRWRVGWWQPILFVVCYVCCVFFFCLLPLATLLCKKKWIGALDYKMDDIFI